MTRPKFWTPQMTAWCLALAGAFVVFVSGGCGLLRRMTQGEPRMEVLPAPAEPLDQRR